MWLGTDVRCLERADIFAFTVEFIHISPRQFDAWLYLIDYLPHLLLLHYFFAPNVNLMKLHVFRAIYPLH